MKATKLWKMLSFRSNLKTKDLMVLYASNHSQDRFSDGDGYFEVMGTIQKEF